MEQFFDKGEFMPYDKRNLAMTVPAGQSAAAQRYRNMRKCKVWRKKKFPPFFVLNGESKRKADSHTNYHEWNKETGLCEHCGLTRTQAREPGIRELKRLASAKAEEEGIQKRKRGRLAREIAMTPKDVPPVRFVGHARSK